MHPSVLAWVKSVLTLDHVSGRKVLEVGSMDVNGSVRPYVESLKPLFYHAVDMQDGPGVDKVVNCERLTEEIETHWDIVISTEMLEHVRDWRTCFVQLVRTLRQNGLLLVTTRSPGFPRHEHPEDHWRYTMQNMRDIATRLSLKIKDLQEDPEAPGVFMFASRAQALIRPLVKVEVAHI